MIDVSAEVNSIRRRVGERVLEAGQARTVTIARTYDAEIEELWATCTEPTRIPRWFLPVSGDLKLGGRYQLQGNAGGTIEHCDPPSGFTATWEYGDSVSWIELRLSPAAEGGTLFELQHISRTDDDTWTRFGPGAVGVGWDLAIMGLGRHLAGDVDVDPEAARAWSASEEGRLFATLSSRRWGEAAVAAGTDPAKADEWTARTTAFYTGAPASA
jgi:uncharacterized protein YndB with AHSA1/START domain